jgi:TRAP-type C4-dicarboxylate transport system substrate-binding protein
MVPYIKFLDRINEQAKGALTIKYLGGPEVVATRDQPQAVRTGVVDMSHVPMSYYVGLEPVLEMMACSEIPGPGERKSGAYNLVNELHKKHDLYYLGRPFYKEGGFQIMLLKRPVKTPFDLAGLKIAGGGFVAQEYFVKDLGMVPVQMPSSEMYQAVERGVVDAICYGPLMGTTGFRWYEVCKYVVDHPFDRPGNSASIINLKTFNSLPKNLQDLLIKESIQLEIDTTKFFDEITKKARETYLANGATFLKFSPADAEWFVQSEHKRDIERALRTAPEVGAKLWEMLQK